MALANDILLLRDRVLADLNAAHDYYVDTKTAWRIVRKVIRNGAAFSSQNTVTGTVTSQSDLAGKARRYMAEQIAAATFQQFISIFENYFFDLLRLWLMAYPQSLSGKKVDFKTVLAAPDKDAIAILVINRELNDIPYDRPTGWFAYLDEKVKLGCPKPDELEKLCIIRTQVARFVG